MSSERVIGVIGSGTMGAGIAQAAATSGFQVECLDTDPELVRRAHGQIGERLASLADKGKITRGERDAGLSRLRIAQGFEAMRGAECVIEAVTEDLALKRRIFGELDQVVSPSTLLATNTSCLSIAKIGEGLRNAGRFLGMHFFNPAPVMKLVELVQGPQTSDQALVDARAICTKLEKIPVKVKDSPGFIGNRVNRPFYLEALHLLEAGEADIRTIDAAVKGVGGFKMGPFELLDLIGLDVNLKVTESVFADFDKPPRFAPNEIQRKLVAAGHLGRKTKRGFYDYANGEPAPAFESKPKDASGWKPTPALSAYAAMLGRPADRATWLFARIWTAVVNEAALVADSIALPRDVNLAMELGFSYPEGPLATADHVGLDVVQGLLRQFHAESGGGARYAPNRLLDQRVAEGDLGEKTGRGFLYHAL